MNPRIASIALFTLFLAFNSHKSTAQTAPQWELDKAHTSVNFSINHFFSEVTGRFTEFDGSFHFDPDNLEGSQFEFTVQVASVNTQNQKRDNHLQSDDFFNAKKYPTMKFRSSSIRKKGKNRYEVTGDLTIRGVTKQVSIPLKVTGQMEHPMMEGTTVMGLAFEYKLDRTDYGVGTGDWASTMVVGDEVRINIPMELNRKSKS